MRDNNFLEIKIFFKDLKILKNIKQKFKIFQNNYNYHFQKFKKLKILFIINHMIKLIKLN